MKDFMCLLRFPVSGDLDSAYISVKLSSSGIDEQLPTGTADSIDGLRRVTADFSVVKLLVIPDDGGALKIGVVALAMEACPCHAHKSLIGSVLEIVDPHIDPNSTDTGQERS